MSFVCIVNRSSLVQERDLGDEYGWKQVHGDVFRPATHPMLFSALIGSGYQICTVSTLTISFAIVGELYTERGSMLSTAIFVYAATAPVNGYFGGSLYARMGGKENSPLGCYSQSHVTLYQWVHYLTIIIL